MKAKSAKRSISVLLLTITSHEVDDVYRMMCSFCRLSPIKVGRIQIGKEVM